MRLTSIKITIIVAVIAVILFVIAVLSNVRTIAMETFSTCPLGSTGFTDASGNAGCCAGTIQGRLCIGTVLCSYSANPQNGVKKCGDVQNEQRQQIATMHCPPLMPFLVGSIESPKGCCSVVPDINGLCPALAQTCPFDFYAKPASTATSIIECNEQKLLETSQCPKNYTLSPPSFDNSLKRFTATCTDAHLNTCYPSQIYKYLTQTGGLVDNVENRKKMCSK